MLTLPAEVLFEIEHELNEPRFMEVPIGSTLGNQLSIEFLMGNAEWSHKSIWSDRFRILYHYFKGPRTFVSSSDNSSIPIKEGRILFTLIHNRPHLHALIVPVLEQFQPNECNILTSDKVGFASLASKAGVLETSCLSEFFELREWQKEYQPLFRKWHAKLKAILSAHSFPLYVIPHLMDAMLVSTQHVFAFRHLLDTLKPRAIVTDFDRGDIASGLILLAKAHGVPTMTMMHGVINSPYGYAPLLADVAFCWGKLSRNQMVAMGTPPERLVITGYHRMVRKIVDDRGAVRKRLGITDDRTLVLFASNVIERADRRQQIHNFCQAFADQEEFIAVVRLHPVEELAFYEKEIRNFPFVMFTEANLMTQDEALLAADLVVVRDSGFGNDALVKGKPVIVLDTIEAPLGNGQVLVEKAHCPHVHHSNELRQITQRIVFDDEYRSDLHRKAEAFVKYQFAAFGDEALANTVRAIRDRIKTV